MISGSNKAKNKSLYRGVILCIDLKGNWEKEEEFERKINRENLADENLTNTTALIPFTIDRTTDGDQPHIKLGVPFMDSGMV